MSRVLAACFCILVAVSYSDGSIKSARENPTFGSDSEPPQAIPLTQLHSLKENAEIADRPYMVSMRMAYEDKYCEAAVLHEDWAITSARCCVRSCGRAYVLDTVKIRSGSTNFNSGGTQHDVETIVLAEGYQLYPSTIPNNLCLVKVKQPFTLGNNVGKLRLSPTQDYGNNQYYGNISGWSNKNAGPRNPLKTVTLPVISNNECQQKYSQASDITDKMVCAVTPDQQTCHGVAGGPLVVDGLLAGVVTTGNGCDNKPGVYTRVSEYSTWIRQYIGYDEDNIIEAGPEIDVRLSGE